ncbi:MAG: C4-dicarboxylic acid transporter DauA [Chromatiales bacterium]|jgi:SulP family sulfate permease
MFSALRRAIRYERSRDSLQANLLAGLTVGVIALPLSMALAIASGVAPQHGLYTAMVAGIVIALTGGSKVNISGPTAAFVVVLLPIVHSYGLGGLLISGFMAGIILVLMGLLRLGRLIEVIPYPVIIGFTAGIGTVIATFQVSDFLGLNLTFGESHFVHKLATIIQASPGLDWQESLIGMITLAVLLVWPKMRSRIPGHLVALLIGTVAAWLLGQFVEGFGVATIGSRFSYEINGITGQGIPPLLPQFEWPWLLPDANGAPIGLSFGLVHTLLGAAITIAVLGALESLLCAVVADGMSGKKHNPNDELIGQGLGNMVAPFFGGIPATAAIARTTASIRAGASSPLASVVHGLFILISILLLAPLLAYLPMASMAALLIMVAWNMSEVRHFRRILLTAPRDDVIVLLTCYSLTVLFDMTIAVAVGVGLAAMLFIRRSISLTEVTNLSQETEHDNRFGGKVAIYDINGPLFFGSAQKALANITSINADVRIVVLDLAQVSMLDMSAIVAMQSIVEQLDKHRVQLLINQLPARMIDKLKRAGLQSHLAEIQYTETIDAALQLCQKLLDNSR